MALPRKSIFFKAWIWSLIGSLISVAIFWVGSSLIDFFQGDIVRFTYGLLVASLVGNFLGASLIAWRVADKYYHARLRQSLRRYARFSLLSLVVAIGILFTPISLLASVWSLASAWCVMLALTQPKKSTA